MSRQSPTPRSDRTLRTDDRAVSEVIGAILMFALLFALLVLIQINAVPAANQQIEFEHDKRVHQDFQSLQDTLYRVGTTGTTATTSIETGVSYPSRFFLLNPPPATGSIRVTSQEWINISNARAQGNVGDYWNGDRVDYATRSIEYEADYNEMQTAGQIRWEHSMLYTRFDTGNLVFDDPTSVVDGRQISLTLLDGRLSQGGLSTTVELAPISTQTRTVTLEDDGQPIELTLRTDLSESEWETALEDEPYATVTGVQDGRVTIRLDADQTYELQVATVRIGSTVAPAPGGRYITDVSGNGTIIPENATGRVTVEVRDEFNNPVSGHRVTATLVDNASLSGDQVRPVGSDTTDSDGQVTLRYEAPDNVDGNQQVRIQTSMGDGTDPGTSVDALERATAEVTILDSDGSGSVSGNGSGDGVSNINPGQKSKTLQLTDGNGLGSNFDLEFTNEADTVKTIDEMRLLFATQNDQSASLEWIQLTGYGPPGDTVNETTLSNEPQMFLYGDYADVTDIAVDPDESVALSFTTNKATVQGDLVAITIRYDDGSVNNYFANL